MHEKNVDDVAPSRSLLTRVHSLMFTSVSVLSSLLTTFSHCYLQNSLATTVEHHVTQASWTEEDMSVMDQCVHNQLGYARYCFKYEGKDLRPFTGYKGVEEGSPALCDQCTPHLY